MVDEIPELVDDIVRNEFCSIPPRQSKTLESLTMCAVQWSFDDVGTQSEGDQLVAERLSMRKIKEVLRLKAAGLSNRQIAASVNVAHSTVSLYLARAAKVSLTASEAAVLDDDQIKITLFGEPKAPLAARVEPDYAYLHKELKRKGVTLQLLWEEYLDVYPDGYRYSQFCARYRAWRGHLKPSLRQIHKAGEKLFVDYAGQSVPVVDADTGEVSDAQIFVATLGASNYTFATATATQELSCWIASHVAAFAFLGGAPRAVVPDNLKSGVTRACRYEPDINPTYQEMAAHYGTSVIPARSASPKDKAKVESGVLVVERWILARLRNRTFFSLAELNEAIAELIIELNERPFAKLDGCRRSHFEELEKDVLARLPSAAYEFAVWAKARVNIDYHVEVDHHYYSVPYQLIGVQVDVRLGIATVEVIHKGRRIASHVRSFVRGGFTTDEAHRPASHAKHLSWTPSRIIAWAAQTGPATEALASGILSSKPHPEHGYRSCLGLLRLGQRYSPARLEAACGRALATRAISYQSVKSILAKGLDRVEADTSATEEVPLAAHDNIRGADYYH